MADRCVHTKDVSYEDAVEIGLLEDLGEVDPVIYVGEFP